MNTQGGHSESILGGRFDFGYRLLCTLLAAVGLSGCAKAPVMAPPPSPTIVTVSITSFPALNPDASGRSSPVTLRVYQLADASSFSKADLLDLWDRETLTLTATLVSRHEFTVAPGSGATGSFDLRPDARHLGIAVAFRDFRDATWRLLIPLPEPQQKSTAMVALSIQLNDKSVSARLQAAIPQTAGAAK